MPQMLFQSSDARRPRASAETRLAASPITSTLRMTASCNSSDAMNVSLTGTDESGDAVTTLQHVVQVQPIVLHNGVASRRILSRTYQCRDFSVPTWTFTPDRKSVV